MKQCVILAGAVLAGSLMTSAAQAQTTTPLIYVQPLSPSAVRLIQDHLRQAGDFNGRADGVWGADSQAALEHFQQTHGLQLSNQLNQVTVTALGLTPGDLLATVTPGAPVASTPAPAAPVALGALGPRAIRAVQTRLRELNYYSGGIDGLLGADTQTAIQRFQQGRGLQASGQLSPATLSALGLNPNALITQPSQ